MKNQGQLVDKFELYIDYKMRNNLLKVMRKLPWNNLLKVMSKS